MNWRQSTRVWQRGKVVRNPSCPDATTQSQYGVWFAYAATIDGWHRGYKNYRVCLSTIVWVEYSSAHFRIFIVVFIDINNVRERSTIDLYGLSAVKPYIGYTYSDLGILMPKYSLYPRAITKCVRLCHDLFYRLHRTVFHVFGNVRSGVATS